MPKLGNESTSSSRRHNPNHTLSDNVPTSSRAWHTHTPARNEPNVRGEGSSNHSSGAFDPPDELLTRTHRSGSRPKWFGRSARVPYASGHRAASKWPSPEQRESDSPELGADASSEPGSDDETEEEDWRGASMAAPVPHQVRRQSGSGRPDESGGQGDGSSSESSEPPTRDRPPPSSGPPPSDDAAAKKREKNKKKKAKARAKAKDKNGLLPVLHPLLPKPPQDVLATMSRIAKLVSTLNTDARQEDTDELFERMRDAFLVEGKPVSPAEWREEVLHSVQRMDDMLRRMEMWQPDVEPSEIEAFRQETRRLETHVRSVVEVNNRLHGRVQPALQVEVASSHDEVTVGGTLIAESNAYPSDTDTGGGRSPQAGPPAKVSDATLLQVKSRVGSSLAHELPGSPSSALPPAAPPAGTTVGVRFATVHTLASRNHNVPPTPPDNPVEHLKDNPWTMVEVLFLLEIVAHFPPAEHGWLFITEVYNNLLITRPLQEWLSKQFAQGNEEEMKMKTILQQMNAETRQLRSRGTPGPAAKGTPAPKSTQAGERGKAAPFGSAEAHAEANARERKPPPAGAGPSTTQSSSEKDAHIVTRLPHPLVKGPADNASAAPPPAQRVLPFRRRRPPLGLPSEDAKAFSQVMQTAASAVRGPVASAESRSVMYTLYAASGSRFPARTAWDCWHRWCTPWIVQEQPAGDRTDKPPIVFDYLAGNLGLPCGTWITQTRGFEYRPVPGTYPDVPGVQHVLVGGYDPRPGMVSFARMNHLTSENAWIAAGLGRSRDGKVSEEVLASRRAKLPATLAGIWPGKAPPPPPKQPPRPASGSGPNTPPASPKPALPHASPAKPPSTTAGPAANGASHTKPAAAPPAASTSQLPFRALPSPYKPPPPPAPRVPEGTLGSTVRRGLSPWFSHAAVRADVLERVTGVCARKAAFMAICAPPPPPPRKSKSKSKAGKVSAQDRAAERLREWQNEREERGALLPLHLRKLVVPPPPFPRGLPTPASSA